MAKATLNFKEASNKLKIAEIKLNLLRQYLEYTIEVNAINLAKEIEFKKYKEFQSTLLEEEKVLFEDINSFSTFKAKPPLSFIMWRNYLLQLNQSAKNAVEIVRSMPSDVSYTFGGHEQIPNEFRIIYNKFYNKYLAL